MHKVWFAIGIAAALALNAAQVPAAEGKTVSSAAEAPHDHSPAETDDAASGGPKKTGGLVDPGNSGEKKGNSGEKKARLHPAGGIVFSSEVLGLLGMDKAELRQKLADGKTLAQIAEERGVSRNAMKKALSDAFNRLLEAKKEKFQAHLDRLLDVRWNAWFHHREKDKKKSMSFFGAGLHGAGAGMEFSG
jgi:lambda repressor-like predicted transcriptional regulator